MNEVVLENFPGALAWIKKTNSNYKFTGSYSKDGVFSSRNICYQVWATKNAETEDTEINVAAWIKPAGFDKQEKEEYEEAVFPFSAEGLAAAKQFIIDKIEKNHQLFE